MFENGIIVMALIPIWFGSKRALANRIKRLKDKEEGKTGDDLDTGQKCLKTSSFSTSPCSLS